MEYFIIPIFAVLAVPAGALIRRRQVQRMAQERDAARAHAIAVAEAEAKQQDRLIDVMTPLNDAIARVHAKLDSILLKLD